MTPLAKKFVHVQLWKLHGGKEGRQAGKELKPAFNDFQVFGM